MPVAKLFVEGTLEVQILGPNSLATLCHNMAAQRALSEHVLGRNVERTRSRRATSGIATSILIHRRI